MSEWTRETVSERIREAWDTLRRLPSADRHQLSAGWPDVVQDYWEAYGQSDGRVRLARATPRAIDRMSETFAWFKNLDGKAHLTKAVWLTCGCGMGPRRAGAILGIHRDTCRARRDEALDRIVDGLSRRKRAA